MEPARLLILTVVIAVYGTQGLDSETGLDPPTYSSTHGPKAVIASNGTLAWRYEGGCWAVCPTEQSVKVNQRVTFRITEKETGWMANLNVGIMYRDPAEMLDSDFVICDPNVTDAMPDTESFVFKEFYSPNDTYIFHVDVKGGAYMTLYDLRTPELIFSGVNVTRPFWMLFNIYGNAKAVELVS